MKVECKREVWLNLRAQCGEGYSLVGVKKEMDVRLTRYQALARHANPSAANQGVHRIN